MWILDLLIVQPSIKGNCYGSRQGSKVSMHTQFDPNLVAFLIYWLDLSFAPWSHCLGSNGKNIYLQPLFLLMSSFHQIWNACQCCSPLYTFIHAMYNFFINNLLTPCSCLWCSRMSKGFLICKQIICIALPLSGTHWLSCLMKVNWFVKPDIHPSLQEFMVMFSVQLVLAEKFSYCFHNCLI